MIPNRKKLKEISRLKEGNLAEIPFAVLIYSMAVEERTLALEISRNHIQKKIVFEDGAPVECTSNLLHETLGKFLIEKGKLDEEGYQKALRESVSSNIMYGEALLKLELITAFDLFKYLQQNLAHKLLDGFTWKSGRFKIVSEAISAASPLKVKVPQLVLTGIVNFAPQDTVDAGISTLIGKTLAAHPYPPVPLSSLKLSAKQAQIMSLLKQNPRIDQMCAETKMQPEELTRFVYAMASLGMIAPKDEIPKEPPPEIKAAPSKPAVEVPVPQPPTPVKAQKSPEEMERLKNEITKKYLSYRKQDAFDLLEIKDDASPLAIREAYIGFAKTYAPWSIEGQEMQSLAEKAQDIFLAGAKAFALLQDHEARNSLIYRRRNPPERANAYADAFQIKTDLLDAETQYKEGLKRMAEGKYGDAVKFFEFASECDPQKGVYRAELEFCRFRLGPSRWRERLQELQEAIRIDPECGLTCYYAGVISVEIGDKAGAEKYFQRAIKLMGSDRRPIEALKRLKLKK